jgi:hypothetical protein
MPATLRPPHLPPIPLSSTRNIQNPHIFHAFQTNPRIQCCWTQWWSRLSSTVHPPPTPTPTLHNPTLQTPLRSTVAHPSWILLRSVPDLVRVARSNTPIWARLCSKVPIWEIRMRHSPHLRHRQFTTTRQARVVTSWGLWMKALLNLPETRDNCTHQLSFFKFFLLFYLYYTYRNVYISCIIDILVQ